MACWVDACTSEDPLWDCGVGGAFAWVHALISVKNRVNLLACNVWTIRCTTLLYMDILRPSRCWLSHVDRRWGHVSLSFLKQSIQLGLGWVKGQKMFILQLHMY
jgi:hypothetical protein